MMGTFEEPEIFVDDAFREGNLSPQGGDVAVDRRSRALSESVEKTVGRVRAHSVSCNTELINALRADKKSGRHGTDPPDRRTCGMGNF